MMWKMVWFCVFLAIQASIKNMINNTLLAELAKRDIHVFLKTYKIQTENGKLLDLQSHRYLVDPFCDFSQRQVTPKSAQCGWSTLAIIKTLWMAKNKDISFAYTLPTSSDAQEFVRTKVNRIIQMNPILQTYVESGDNIGDKRVGKANIFYRGSYAEKQAISFTADALCFDEVDRSDQSVLGTYASRLQHSDYKGEWYFSNPSVQGHGVSRFWALSDQKHWFIKCGKCFKEQYLEWPHSVCLERRIFQCKKCFAPIDNEVRRMGRWVKRFREKDFSGYWISLLMSPWVTAEEIIKYSQEKSKEYFANFVLGVPYIGEGNTVPEHVIYRNLTDKVNSQDDVVIGCDSGLIKHYVLGNKQGIFYYGKTGDWNDIRGLLKRFHRSIAVIDALPDLTEPRRLVEEFPGRVFICHFSPDRKTMQLIRWGKGEEFGTVTVDRNRTLQLLIDEFADGRIPLQGNRDDWAEFYEHWKVLYRMDDVDHIGNPTFKWESSNSTDHWVFASIYWRTGMDKQANIGGGSILGIQHNKFPTAPTIAPDGTMPAPDLSMPKKSDEWRL